jgi:ketosteroid isomerase-like protein
MDNEQLIERLALLEGKLQRLEDMEAIKALHRRYIRKLADRDWEGMADMFTDDAVTDIRSHGRTVGKQQLIDSVFDELHGLVRSADGYILSSPVIEIAPGGEVAHGEWTWHRHICEFRTYGGYMRIWGPWMEGRYRCQYRRVEGEWKFSDVWFRVVLPDPDLSQEEMQARLAAAPAHVTGKGLLDR